MFYSLCLKMEVTVRTCTHKIMSEDKLRRTFDTLVIPIELRNSPHFL